MYAKVLTLLLGLLLATFSAPAWAHQRGHHHARHHHRGSTWELRTKTPEWPHSTFFGPRWTDSAQPARHRALRDGRPRRWCGWYMRHRLGVADTAYNLARNWTHYGHATSAHAGAIAVWPHHVGQIVQMLENGLVLVLSGNDGHAVRERPRSLRGAIAFREN